MSLRRLFARVLGLGARNAGRSGRTAAAPIPPPKGGRYSRPEEHAERLGENARPAPARTGNAEPVSSVKKPPAIAGDPTSYADALKASNIGSHEHGRVLDAMAADRGITRAKMIEIANSIGRSYKTPRSATRREALRRIRLAHEAYLDSARKSDAISGGGAA